MKPTYEELEAQNQELRRAISPLEDPIFTSELEAKLREWDGMEDTRRQFRGAEHYVLYPSTLWDRLYGHIPNKHEVTVISRSLQALLWERSAINGARVFVKKVDD